MSDLPILQQVSVLFPPADAKCTCTIWLWVTSVGTETLKKGACYNLLKSVQKYKYNHERIFESKRDEPFNRRSSRVWLYSVKSSRVKYLACENIYICIFLYYY